MLFYKAKYDAATPTRVQVNVPTNTDYMIGTELYVKGEKKDITAENVTLKDGETVITADTTVNGIPAFTMKSLDAEADKLYDVEFKNTNTNTTWDAALSAFTIDGDLFEYESFTNNKFQFRVLKDMTIKAPFKVVNNEYVDNGDDYTYLEGKNSANNEIYDGTLDFPDYSIVLSSATNGTCTLFAITKSDIATHSLPSKSSYFIMSAGATYASEFALKAGDAITIAKKSGFGANAPKVNYFQVGEDAYNYKFKLFINEDEQAYGFVDAVGLESVSWDDIQDKPDVLTPSSSEIVELDSTVSALSESFGELDSTVSNLALTVDDVDAKVDELDSTVSGLIDSLSSYATTSAMESYVDAQIGAVLSMNF